MKRMKTWRGWCIVDADGIGWTPQTSALGLRSDLNPGERIARVEIREVVPKRRRKTK